MREVELVLDAHAIIGEGPRWEPGGQQLVWVDIRAGQIHLFEPASGTDRVFDVGQPVGVAVYGPPGTLIAACADGFYSLEMGSGLLSLLAHVEAGDTDTRMNDGACDALGRLWAGTMSDTLRPAAGSLYRFDADRRVNKMLSNLSIANGIDWSPDNKTMYYIDSPTQSVDVFDFDLEAGTISNRRSLVQVPNALGMPDGLAVDAEGCVWVAMWGGGAVHRYSPTGKLVEKVQLPVSFVSSCTFGGEDYSDLYITTARYFMTQDELARQPSAGGVFKYRPRAVGRPTNRWAGTTASSGPTRRLTSKVG